MSKHAKPVKTTALLFAGVLAALCWTVGDMLLVGFVPQPERHPQLAVLAGRMEGDVQMAALMLDAAPARLLWGVLPATFSAPFYLAAAFGVYRLLRPGRAAVLCFALLFFSYALAPLAHAGFYYLGMSAKTLLHAAPADHALLLEQFAAFYKVLAVHWWASVGSMAAAFLILLVQTARGRTLLPRRAAWFNPLPLGVLIAFSCRLFPESALAAAVGGATFNLAQLVFFLSAWCCLQRKKAV